MKKLFILYFIILIAGALAEEKETQEKPQENKKFIQVQEDAEGLCKVVRTSRRGREVNSIKQQKVKA